MHDCMYSGGEPIGVWSPSHVELRAGNFYLHWWEGRRTINLITGLQEESDSERDLFAIQVCTDKEFALAGRCIQ